MMIQIDRVIRSYIRIYWNPKMDEIYINKRLEEYYRKQHVVTEDIYHGTP